MDNKLQFEMVLKAEESITGNPPYFLTTLDNPDKGGGMCAGRVCDIPASRPPEPPKRHAARLIAGHTHRLSTPEEIADFHADLKRQTEELARQAHALKQQFALPDDLKALVRTAALIVEREANQPTKKTKETS